MTPTPRSASTEAQKSVNRYRPAGPILTSNRSPDDLVRQPEHRRRPRQAKRPFGRAWKKPTSIDPTGRLPRAPDGGGIPRRRDAQATKCPRPSGRRVKKKPTRPMGMHMALAMHGESARRATEHSLSLLSRGSQQLAARRRAPEQDGNGFRGPPPFTLNGTPEPARAAGPRGVGRRG